MLAPMAAKGSRPSAMSLDSCRGETPRYSDACCRGILSDRQVRTIITRQMKVAPLDLALQLTDTLNVPLEVWLGVKNYSPTELSADAYEVARAYDRADLKSRNMVRMALDLPLVKGETV